MSRPYRYRDLFARSRRLWLVRREPLAYGWSPASERRRRLARSKIGRLLRIANRVLHPRAVLAAILRRNHRLARWWSRCLLLGGRCILIINSPRDGLAFYAARAA